MHIEPRKESYSAGDSDPVGIKTDMKSLPNDVIQLIFFMVDEKDLQSLASTEKFWNTTTVGLVKKLAVSEFVSLTNKIKATIDKICEKLEKNDNSNESEIKDLIKIKEQVSALQGEKILGSTHLLEIKSSIAASKIALAKLVSILPQNILDEYLSGGQDGFYHLGKDVLALSKLYKELESTKNMPDNDTKDLALKGIALNLVQLGDLETALMTSAEISYQRSRFGFTLELFSSLASPLSDHLLDQILEIFDRMPSTVYKADFGFFIVLQLMEKNQLDKAVEVVDQMVDTSENEIDSKSFSQSILVSLFAGKGDFEKVEEILNNIKIKDPGFKEDMVNFISERRENQSIIREFHGTGVIQKQDIDALIEVVDKLADTEKKSCVLKAIVEELTYNNLNKEATEIANTITDSSLKDSLLKFIKEKNRPLF